MARPFVRLSTENHLEELLAVLRRHLGRFLAFGEVVGILLSGGLARGYADHLSEIDLIIFVTSEQYARFKREKTPIPLGITKIEGYLYDIKLEDYSAALAREYSMDALWDLSYAQILYDPQGQLGELIKAKLTQPPDVSLAAGFLFEAWWHYKLAGDIWRHRKDVAQGHYVLNKAVKPLLSALFVACGEYVPHDKWLVHMSRTLPGRPEGWEELLQAALSTGAFDLASLAARQAALDTIWNAVDAKLRRQTGSRVSMMQKRFYDLLLALVERGSLPLEEWEQLGGLDLLNSEPFHQVARIEGGSLVLDRDRLPGIGPQDMYSWFYAIVQAVVENSRRQP